MLVFLEPCLGAFEPEGVGVRTDEGHGQGEEAQKWSLGKAERGGGKGT